MVAEHTSPRHAPSGVFLASKVKSNISIFSLQPPPTSNSRGWCLCYSTAAIPRRWNLLPSWTAASFHGEASCFVLGTFMSTHHRQWRALCPYQPRSHDAGIFLFALPVPSHAPSWPLKLALELRTGG